MSVAAAVSVDSERDKAADISGSGGDQASDETVSIVGTGASAQHNCTLCAGAITQEVECNFGNIYDELAFLNIKLQYIDKNKNAMI